MKVDTCIFCSIVSGYSKAEIIYHDSSFVALLDKYPFSSGHSLVIPRKHYEDLLKMPKEEVGYLYSTVSVIASAISKALNPEGLNIGQNNGRAANQIIPHVHVHIIPRFKHDIISGRWPSRHLAHDLELQEISGKIRSVLATTSIGG
ncbi:MAG TPA: HIT family protein [Nitrososphaeraceae archaeon]|jgi:histidine triad (HIT) family protein